MFNCKCCTPFKTYKYQKSLYRHQRKYDCNYVDPITARKQNYLLDPRKCITCGNVIDYDSEGITFCSRTCAAIHNNRVHPKKGTARTPGDCLYCSTKLKRHTQKYCNNKCCRQHKKEIDYKLYENGEITFSDQRAKKYHLAKYGHQCSRCGLSEWMDEPIPLEMDHIDGDPSNNHISNLRILCCNCHALTPTFKARNRGNGRELRREKRRLKSMLTGLPQI